MMERFQEIVDQRHEYARQWKRRTGGKVIGYLCTYAPEEIIYAAGMLPVRILGAHQPQDLTEAHIYNMYCSLCRDCLAQGLAGRYDYLDGLVFSYSCIHMCQTYDSWKRHIPTPFSHLLYMPANVLTPHALAYYADELRRFTQALEAWAGTSLRPAHLRGSIATYNRNRRLLRQLYELRRREAPPISGAEVLPVVLSSMFMDKAEHSQLLEELVKEREGRQDGRQGVRVLTFGGENDDVALVRLIEELGAVVVADDQCAGSRYFWNEVEGDGDLLTALSRRYLQRPPCPQKDLEGKVRIPHLIQMVQDYAVQGAIFVQQKFCDPHAYDAPFILAALKEKGVPCLTLEYDIIIPVGQYRTRIEAFLEMIGTMAGLEA